MNSCYAKLKKTVKFVCFWVIILSALDAGITSLGYGFLANILTQEAEIVLNILAGLSAVLVLLFVIFGHGCCGKKICKCGCEYGCECGCGEDGCKCGDDCKCDKDTKKQDKKDACCSVKPADKK